MAYPELNAAIQMQMDVAAEMLYASDKPREHLGASIIAEDCAAKVWFGFRWAKHGQWGGRMLRLFNTGHKEEARFIEWFKAIGFVVSEFAEDGNQHRISAASGHFGGSLDSRAMYVGNPAIDNELSHILAQLLNYELLLEFKTHNRKNMDKLKKNGVKVAFYKHYVQMSTYGKFYGYKHGIYAGYCKDNDYIHIEVVELDWSLAADMVRKAEELIVAKRLPQRIAENPTYYECKGCQFNDICHNGAPMQKNCRSCRHADAADNKQWYCSVHNANIPQNIIPFGCDSWAQLDVAY